MHAFACPADVCVGSNCTQKISAYPVNSNWGSFYHELALITTQPSCCHMYCFVWFTSWLSIIAILFIVIMDINRFLWWSYKVSMEAVLYWFNIYLFIYLFQFSVMHKLPVTPADVLRCFMKPVNVKLWI